MKHQPNHQIEKPRFVDGLVNPKSYHRPAPIKRRKLKFNWKHAITALVLVVISAALVPTVKSFTRQYEVLDLLTHGRYMVLFQNDTEIRPSGGFIGSFAIVEAADQKVKPLYFETNIYKLDNPFTATTKIAPPKPLQVAVPNGSWAMRDSNFASDFRQSAPTVAWFFEQEAKTVTGTKRAELDKALSSNYKVDGVVGITLSAFLDILNETGPLEVPHHNITVNKDNFFTIVQQVVERDYFNTAENKESNEPKTILKDLFPVAMNRTQSLPKTTLYKLATKLLREKKVVIYSNNAEKEQILVEQGWAGALELAADKKPEGKSDFLGVIRSSHGGNKSSIDINPVYRYTVTSKDDTNLLAKLEITFEHTGTGTWPGGINHEYLRVLAPDGATLDSASRNGLQATADVDIGKEMDKRAFGFWLHTNPQSSQSFTLNYTIPKSQIASDYELVLYRQPGGNNPDVTITYDKSTLLQGRLIEDRVLRAN